MRIAYLIDDCPPESFGGAGIVAFCHIKEMAKRGHTVLVVTTTRDAQKEGKETYEDINMVRIYAHHKDRWQNYVSIYNPKTVRKISVILKEFRADIVHAHNIHQFISYYSLLIAKKYSPRVIMTVRDAMLVEYGKLYPRRKKHGKYDYRVSLAKQIRENRWRWNPFRNIFIKLIISQIDGIYSPSESLAQALRQNGVIIKGVIHDGIDSAALPALAGEKEEFRKRYDLAGKKVMLFGGRVSTAKGALVALEFLELVSKKIPNATLLVVGKKDSYAGFFLDEAKKRKLSDRVVHTGWLDRTGMAEAYAVSDVVLVLSLYLDPFPTINLEAMSMKKPIVGSCLGGTPEAVENEVTGLIIDPYEIEKEGERIADFIDQDALLNSYGEAGKIRVWEEFDVRKTAEKMEEQINRLV